MRSRPVLGVSVLALSAVSAPARADWPEVQKRGSLRVLVMLDTRRPEFFSLDHGAPGFDHEVLEGFASLQRIKLDIKPVESWDALLPALEARKGDVVAGRFTVTESRTRIVNFTTEVFPTRNVVINRKPRKPVTTLEGLRAEKVGTIKGTSMAEAIAAAAVPSVDDGLPAGSFGEALKSGRVTAAVWPTWSRLVVKYFGAAAPEILKKARTP